MGYDNNEKRIDSVYSQRVRAGKRRTYFFDVKETRGNDYYLTITESRRKFNEDGYDRHKIFLYKEDFNKFLKGMTEAIDFVKTELMPDFDFDIFSHENDENYQQPAQTNLSGENEEQSAPNQKTTDQEAVTEKKEPEIKSEDTASEPDEIVSDNSTDAEHKDGHVDKW